MMVNYAQNMFQPSHTLFVRCESVGVASCTFHKVCLYNAAGQQIGGDWCGGHHVETPTHLGLVEVGDKICCFWRSCVLLESHQWV
jgi:hypothetical protein